MRHGLGDRERKRSAEATDPAGLIQRMDQNLHLVPSSGRGAPGARASHHRMDFERIHGNESLKFFATPSGKTARNREECAGMSRKKAQRTHSGHNRRTVVAFRGWMDLTVLIA